jgi:hypothetical protein
MKTIPALMSPMTLSVIIAMSYFYVLNLGYFYINRILAFWGIYGESNQTPDASCKLDVEVLAGYRDRLAANCTKNY